MGTLDGILLSRRITSGSIDSIESTFKKKEKKKKENNKKEKDNKHYMKVVREAFCRDIDTFSWEFGKFEDPDNPESWQIAKFVFYVLLVISVIILIAVLIYLKKYYKAIFVICYIIVWIITIYMYNTP